MSTPPIKRDWLAKTIAGAVLGLSLAFACSGLFALAAQGMAANTRAQLMMWLVAPVWLAVFACTYFFRSGRQAWARLVGANLLAWGALHLASLC